MTERELRLAKALQKMVAAFEPFRSRPHGAPGSEARERQEKQIAAHDEANEILREYRIIL